MTRATVEARAELELIQQDLHVDSIAPCDNLALFEAVRRSQCLIFVTSLRRRTLPGPRGDRDDGRRALAG